VTRALLLQLLGGGGGLTIFAVGIRQLVDTMRREDR
jgi:hypothetical protein